MCEDSIDIAPQQLKAAILTELETISHNRESTSKDDIRDLHMGAVLQQIAQSQPWIQETWPKRQNFLPTETM